MCSLCQGGRRFIEHCSGWGLVVSILAQAIFGRTFIELCSGLAEVRALLQLCAVIVQTRPLPENVVS